ncbi:MAG: sulfotransferase [Geminicoccaceae bacterium]
MLPNLFVLGAEPACTALLRGYLAQHPEIFLPRMADPSYFTFAGGVPEQRVPRQIAADKRAHRALRRAVHADAVTTAHAYRRLYRRAGGRTIRADLSSAHLDSLAAAARIRGCAPDARLVAILRNPVDRAHTLFERMRRDGLEPLPSFVDALAAEPERQLHGWASAWLYTRGGFYHRQLEPYVRYFGRERLHVVLHEDLLHEPEAEMRRLFQFAGIAADIPLRRAGQQVWLRQLLARLARPTEAVVSAPLSLDVRAMLSARYAEDIAKLEGLIGRDLGCWRMPDVVTREFDLAFAASRFALAA